MFLITATMIPLQGILSMKLYCKYLNSSENLSDASRFTMNSHFLKALGLCVPLLLNPVRINKNEDMFKKRSFSIRLISDIAVITTFGVAFPPVAFVGCISLINFTGYYQLNVGRLFSTLQDNDRNEVLLSSGKYLLISSPPINMTSGVKATTPSENIMMTVFMNTSMQYAENNLSSLNDSIKTPSKFQIIEESFSRSIKGTSILIQRLIYMIAPFFTLFYSFVVFDTLGDTTNWKMASSVASCVAISPCVIWLADKIIRILILKVGNENNQQGEEIRNSILANNIGKELEKQENDNSEIFVDHYRNSVISIRE
jgi:hypothetical protein